MSYRRLQTLSNNCCQFWIGHFKCADKQRQWFCRRRSKHCLDAAHHQLLPSAQTDHLSSHRLPNMIYTHLHLVLCLSFAFFRFAVCWKFFSGANISNFYGGRRWSMPSSHTLYSICLLLSGRLMFHLKQHLSCLSLSLFLSLSLYLPFCPSFAFAYIHPSNYQLFIASFRLPFTSVRLCTFACVVCSACARLKIAADRTWTAETSKRFDV